MVDSLRLLVVMWRVLDSKNSISSSQPKYFGTTREKLSWDMEMDNTILQDTPGRYFSTPEELSRMVATTIHRYLWQQEAMPNPPPPSLVPPLYTFGREEQSRESQVRYSEPEGEKKSCISKELSCKEIPFSLSILWRSCQIVSVPCR